MVLPLARKRHYAPTNTPKTRTAQLQADAMAVLREEGVFHGSLSEWITAQDLSKRGCYHMSQEPMFYIQYWASEAGLILDTSGDVISIRDPKFIPKVRHPIAIQRGLFDEES